MNDDSNRDVVIFEQALCLPEAERAAHVERASGGDADLRHRVEVLLRAFKKAGDFLQGPPPGLPGGLGQSTAKGERPGDWIGRYKLLQQIGEGGYGVVFMAEQEEPVRRRVALKVIKPGMDTKSVINRFEAERQALALMDHPDIAKIFDAGATESGRPYFVMELVRGIKITEYCDQNSLTNEERLKLFIQVCQAIQHAHQKGVIHRDIKPSNVLVTKTLEGNAQPVVIDFGIAKATTSQRLTNKTLFTAFEMLIGTPAYMSPEQAALTRADVDTRTDIYSLGVLLYELLTGLTPFDTGELLKAGVDEIRRVIREQEPVRPSTRLNKLFGPESQEVAGSLNDLGRELLAKSELAEADTVVGQALAIRRRLFGDENVDTATSLNDLGSVYMAERRLAESEALIRGALEIRRKLFGNESLEVADSLHNLCVILGDEGRRAESETNAEEELVIRRQLLGSNDVSVASALLDVAWGAGWAGNLDKEQSSYEDALEIQRKLLGDWHPYVIKSVAQLGENMRKRGNLPEAHAVLITAISVQRKILGDDHPDTLASLGCLGRILESEGKWADAETVNREALNSWRKRSGNAGEGTLWESEQLALDLTAQNKLGEAEQVLNDVLTPESIRKPASANLLSQRISLAGRQGQWRKAAADAVIFLEDDPKDPYRYHMLAGFWAMTHNRAAYEGLCRRLLPMFADATNCYVAERTAADCLLLPDSGIDLKQLDKLADTAVITGSNEFGIGYFEACKALSEYRQGRFSGAAEWAEKSSKDSSVFARAKGCAVLAMSQWQLGRKDEARTTLARGNALMPRISPADEHVDLGESWVAWLFSRIALDEAGALIQPSLTSENGTSDARRNN